MSTPNIQFTIQDIYELHNQLEDAFILSSGVRDENLLASAVNTPFQTFMGTIYMHPSTIKQHNYVMVSSKTILLQMVTNELHFTACMYISLSMDLILLLHNKQLKI